MKTLSTFIVLFLVSCLITTAGSGQTIHVRGKVIDKTTQQPLPGVNIYLQDNQLGIGTITNQQGEFRLWNLPQDTSNILISLEGYESSSIDVDLLNGSSDEITIIMLGEETHNMGKAQIASDHKVLFLKKRTLSRK